MHEGIAEVFIDRGEVLKGVRGISEHALPDQDLRLLLQRRHIERCNVQPALSHLALQANHLTVSTVRESTKRDLVVAVSTKSCDSKHRRLQVDDHGESHQADGQLVRVARRDDRVDQAVAEDEPVVRRELQIRE